MFIEVIARNYQECQIIEQAGNIDRIELCTNLSQRGFHHPMQLLGNVLSKLKFPFG